MPKHQAVIIGAGNGLSAALAREFSQDHQVTLAARDGAKAQQVAEATGATLVQLNATDEPAVAGVMDALPTAPRLVIYNPSARFRGPVAELDIDAVRKAVDVTAIGALIAAKHAARRMLDATPIEGCRGTILFTGASAGVKGFANSAPFAMGKFAQRGLAESMARELHPKGIHVAWINVDGAIRNPGRDEPADRPDSLLDPDEIAKSYRHLYDQNRSAWTHELAVRPWVEVF